MADRSDRGDATEGDGSDGRTASSAADDPGRSVDSIDPETLAERLRSGESVTVLDVRNRDEFERWRLEGPDVEAVQVPPVRFVQAEAVGNVTDLVEGLEEPILAVCGRGEASAHAVSLLREADVDARNLAGGMDAWADLYVARELDANGPATVVQYARPSSGCLAYLLVADGDAAVIDPLRAFADRYAEDAAARGADLRYAIDTHVHADHVSGVRELAARSGADEGSNVRPVVPAGARDRGLAFDATLVDDGDELRIGDATLVALATPGHTSESTSFRLGDEVLFTGDTLFVGGVGRPDLEAGRDAAAAARRLYETLRDRVLTLPGETTVAPGHYADAAEADSAGRYVASLETLRDRLELLEVDEREFVSRVANDLPPRPNNDERIVRVNLGRERVDDDTAFELELGPNNCAVGG